MGPELSFSVTRTKISDKAGYNSLSVTFSSDIAYSEFECRATKVGADYGVGKGGLVASFSYTPAATNRTFEIYDTHLVNGDGEYRISLFAKSADTNTWNDNHAFVVGGDNFITADGKTFLCVR
ncbi:MAG TPA: hypothetical protein PLZ27_05970 [Bacillota bacterium]|nr:hypothetical protein [Bacillota bacterium]